MHHLLRGLGLALLVSAPASAGAGCPFGSISVATLGEGVGVCSTSSLEVVLDVPSCALRFSHAQDPFWCGNTYLTQHFLALGFEVLPEPFPLPQPLFVQGAALRVIPLVVLGPFGGSEVALPLPPDPAFIGIPLAFQSYPAFLTTTSFPFEPEYGSSPAVVLRLQ
jgi:hypothetical protein